MAVATAMRRIGAGLAVVALIAAAAIVVTRLRHHGPVPPSCRVSSATTTYILEVDQAANSTTIAAVGKQLGLPDHAVTIALATALQESQLHNLGYGDRDSLGLFQQRPSQGWGTASDILTPTYAATAFFRALTRIDNWATLPVTEAAQKVQRSAAPSAYARWEDEARTLARAVTGETAAGLACRFSLARTREAPPAVDASLGRELGLASLAAALPPARGWAVASWLVGHAQQFRVTTVSYRGQEWRSSTGRWRTTKPAADLVRFRQQPAST